MQIEMCPIDRVKPYAGNPRQNEAAIEPVAESIRGNEAWAPIPGYEGLYEVSSHGRVRRSSRSRMAPAGHVLKPRRTWDGYLTYALSKRQRYWHVKAHRLVALAFLGTPPFPGPHVAHFDGDKLNNHVSNLRWATSEENEADKKRHGRAHGAPPGERHPMARLTADLVRAMRRHAALGETFKTIAERFGVAKLTAYEAIFGITWKTVKEPPPVPRRKRMAS